jgi:hypothetical protein
MGREEGHLPESDRDESARLSTIGSQSTPTTRWHSLAGFLLFPPKSARSRDSQPAIPGSHRTRNPVNTGLERYA